MEYNVQIAVVGGGASGMAAAVAAAEQGVSVAVIEANKALGGNGLFPRGIFGVDSVIQRRKLIFADADDLFRRCMDYSHWKLDARIVRALIEKSGDTISWLTEKGVEFIDVVHHMPNQTPEVFHITDPLKDNTGMVVIKALKARAEALGVTILTDCRARSLIKDGGAVCGVVCDDHTVRADRVVVCTGGFSGNEEFVKRYFPGFDSDKVTRGAGMRHRGDGFTMAIEAGADVEGNFAMEMSGPKIDGHEPLNVLIGKPQSIWVNSLGARFADEGIVYDFTSAAWACMRQPDAAAWVLFDKGIKEKTLADGRDMIELIHIPLDAEEKLPSAIEAAQADGTMCVSEKLEDIAAFIGVGVETLKDTIDEYNACCEHNRDPVFAKAQRNLLPLKNPPYYAVKAGVSMIVTHGGVRVNERFEALDDARRPVPGLYVAGVDFGGADADVYDIDMSGHGFGFAVNSGRIAGEKAAVSLLSAGI